MREIKFRAWETGEEIMHPNVTNGVYQDPDEIIDFDFVLGLERFKVMQYTGLKDKDGTEIFEGDIVSFVGDRKGNRVVEYKNEEACFIARNLIGTGYLEPVYLNDMDFEIIGNIYENTELLEVEANA